MNSRPFTDCSVAQKCANGQRLSRTILCEPVEAGGADGGQVLPRNFAAACGNVAVSRGSARTTATMHAAPFRPRPALLPPQQTRCRAHRLPSHSARLHSFVPPLRPRQLPETEIAITRCRISRTVFRLSAENDRKSANSSRSPAFSIPCILISSSGPRLPGVCMTGSVSSGGKDCDSCPFSLYRRLWRKAPEISWVFADGGYGGPKLRDALTRWGVPGVIEIIEKPEDVREFTVLPRPSTPCDRACASRVVSR